MRIALVVERFERAGGGVEQAAWNVAHALADAGEDVHVVTRTGEARGVIRTRAGAPLTVHHLRIPATWQPLRIVAFSRAAHTLTKKLRPVIDVVHSFSRTRHQDVFRAGGGSHADYMQRAYGPRRAALRLASPRHRALLGMESRIFRDRAQLIHCVSHMVRREIATRWNLPEQRLVVIHNGVDHSRFAPEKNREAGQAVRRAVLGDTAGDEPTSWLFAGSGAHRKGLDTAMRALALCSDPTARLWIAGRDDPAPWRRLAEELGITSRVDQLGARDDMPAVYAAADALVLPTRYDAFANVCLEAAASALPVVTSGANGAVEAIGDAAIVVPDPEDAAGHARAMDDLADLGRRQAMGECGRKLALRNGWDVHAEQLRALYRQRIAMRAGGEAVPGTAP